MTTLAPPLWELPAAIIEERLRVAPKSSPSELEEEQLGEFGGRIAWKFVFE
jgi:hypothetical protein